MGELLRLGRGGWARRHLREGLLEATDVTHDGQARERRERAAHVAKEDVRRGFGRCGRGVGSGELRELVDGVKKQDEVFERLPVQRRRQRRHLPRCVGVLRAERAARGAPVDARLAGAKVQGRADAAALGVDAGHEGGCERAERARSGRLHAERDGSRCAVHGRLCLPVLGVRASAA